MTSTRRIEKPPFAKCLISLKLSVCCGLQQQLIANDDLIADILNRNGLATGRGNRWTRERVTSLRSHQRISFKLAEDGIVPWLNLNNAARLLKFAPRR